MFKIGDLIIYSGHGICKIDDICEKTVAGITRMYYVLHPLENHQLTISTPVDNELILELMNKDEASAILASFQTSGIEWEEKPNNRIHTFSKMLNSGDRIQIAKVVNTLKRKKIEFEQLERKFYDREQKILHDSQQILFKELAISLDTTVEEISNLVNEAIK